MDFDTLSNQYCEDNSFNVSPRDNQNYSEIFGEDEEIEEDSFENWPPIIVEDVLSKDMFEKCSLIYEELKNVKNQKMEIKKIGVALRKIGLTPTEYEVQRHIKMQDPLNEGFILKDQLEESAAYQSLIPLITREQLATSLHQFEDEYIETDQIFKLLITAGEPLQIKDAGRFVKMADPLKKHRFHTGEFLIRLDGKKKKKLKKGSRKNRKKK